MTEYGVHSEVGKLRKVMVHRPELSLQRLTPTNHDDLLFDDVLWVERAQYEHDQFVERMRDRNIEVYLFRDLLAEALTASEEGRTRLIEVAVSEYTVGLSLVDEVRSALAALSPDDLATHLIGGLTVEESGIDLGTFREFSLPAAALDDTNAFVLPPLPNTLFTRDSSCWIYGGVSINPMYWPARRLEAYNVAAIYRYHPMFQDAGFEYWYPHMGADDRFEAHDFGRSSLEGGDVQPIGNGTVLIGLSERTQARMIEQIARALFAKGAAERVIAVVMTKDRAHMHLDTVFTMLDRDTVTLYPKVMDQVRAISLRPGSDEGRFHVTEEEGFLPAVADALGVDRTARGRDRRRCVPAGARAVGRRQQRGRARARRGRRLRTEHVHDREDARGRRRGRHDRGVRTGQGSRRRSLHDLPAAPRPAVEEAVMSGAWRWILGVLIALLIVGLLGYARGRDHHRGDDVGSGSVATTFVG